jgi:2-methylcitrate dehydratase PrpD
MNPGHYDAGWHTTGTFGTVAAAAAVAKALGLDAEGIGQALSLGATSASGLRGNIGAMAKPYHAGNAARAGFYAGFLARSGFTGMEQIFDRKHGFLEAFGEGPAAYADVIGGLGVSWEIETTFGLGLKPYPCCGEATSVVEAALSLREEVAVGEIDHIMVSTNQHATRILTHPRPTTVEQARFSLPYCFAAPFLTGDATEQTFHLSSDDRVQALMGKVEHVVDERHGTEREFGANVSLFTRDGRELRREIPVVKGWADRWLSREEQLSKFVTCTRRHLEEGAARTLSDRLHDLESVTDVAQLLLEGTVAAATPTPVPSA